MRRRKKVNSYKVYLTNPKPYGFAGGAIRSSVIRVLYDRVDGHSSAQINFCRDVSISHLGKMTARGLFVVVDASEFSNYLHLLQTESPLYWSYSLRDETNDVESYILSSESEETGEGFMDDDSDAAG